LIIPVLKDEGVISNMQLLRQKEFLFLYFKREII
jgi:hypothetical protein